MRLQHICTIISLNCTEDVIVNDKRMKEKGKKREEWIQDLKAFNAFEM